MHQHMQYNMNSTLFVEWWITSVNWRRILREPVVRSSASTQAYCQTLIPKKLRNSIRSRCQHSMRRWKSLITSETETLDLCQRKSFLAMRQGGILFWIFEFIAHFIMMRQVFSYVFVLFGNCQQDEAGINYIFWIYRQHQATIREVQG